MEKILCWVKRKFNHLIIALVISMANVQLEILKPVAITARKSSGWFRRAVCRNPLLEKFFQGQRDEQYVQEFYEILKKADKFKREATPHQMGVAADKYAKTYGQKDKGRRYEHFGFFDEKHKYHGKTLKEVIEIEKEERRTKDDDYKIVNIIDNTPKEVGFSDLDNVIDEFEENKQEKTLTLKPSKNYSKYFVFPIKVHREKDVTNKIEEITETLHIKKIAFNVRRLEFFVPIKFGTLTFDDNTKVVKELKNIKEIYVQNHYGELTGYGINNFVKRLKYNELYEVFKFDGFEMEKLNY